MSEPLHLLNLPRLPFTGGEIKKSLRVELENGRDSGERISIEFAVVVLRESVRS